MNIVLHGLDRVRRPALALLVALALLSPVFARPAPAAAAETAGQRSTRTIVLGALAVAGGIVLYNNYHQKYVASHTVVGYTRDGGKIFADGRIVYPDGTTVYTSDNGRTVCTWDGYGGNANQCRGTVYGYYPQGGFKMHRHHGHENDNDNDDDQGEDDDD